MYALELNMLEHKKKKKKGKIVRLFLGAQAAFESMLQKNTTVTIGVP